jgi:tetratricopeptide (TPR) repeat protein
MPASAPVRTRRWQAIGITLIVGTMALGAAAAGWWYARESPPHQGPIVLIAIDGLSNRDLAVYGDPSSTLPSIDALAAEGVTFTRAYAHSPQTLPGYTTLLTGRLPFEHGVRDDGGFVLRPEVRTLAELLRNRGFATGGAVSTFLLRSGTGVAQGFSFFDSRFGEADTAVERDGDATARTALAWLDAQGDQRFFLFLEAPKAGADGVVASVVARLKQRGIYESATIFVVGGRGSTQVGARLDDASLRVAFVVKQPHGAFAGRRVAAPVQLADIAPTILDLVRAPMPGGLHGRSLRPVLDDADGTVPSRPFYAESMAAYYRMGAAPSFALTTESRRLLREAADTIVPMPAIEDGSAQTNGPVPESVPLGAVLDELVAGSMPSRPEPLSLSEESRLSAAGFLAGPEPRPEAAPLVVVADVAAFDAHARAARLVGEGKFAEAIAALESIVKVQPDLGAVHYGIGQLLTRMGRLEEAAAAFERAEQTWPGSLSVALALSDTLRRMGKLDLAKAQAETAIARAERGSPRDRVAAHESAARVALALKDEAAATTYAAVTVEADPTSALPRYVRGRLLYDAGKYEEAVEAFTEPEPSDDDEAMPAAVAELELYKGESLARLERTEDAEMAFRNEIEAFPRDPRAYLSLVTLYQSTKPEEIEEVLDDLLEAVPTPEGYGLAAAAWATVGDTRRANAIRADARIKFRGDPTLGRLFGRGARR